MLKKYDRTHAFCYHLPSSGRLHFSRDGGGKKSHINYQLVFQEILVAGWQGIFLFVRERESLSWPWVNGYCQRKSNLSCWKCTSKKAACRDKGSLGEKGWRCITLDMIDKRLTSGSPVWIEHNNHSYSWKFPKSLGIFFDMSPTIKELDHRLSPKAVVRKKTKRKRQRKKFIPMPNKCQLFQRIFMLYNK